MSQPLRLLAAFPVQKELTIAPTSSGTHSKSSAVPERSKNLLCVVKQVLRCRSGPPISTGGDVVGAYGLSRRLKAQKYVFVYRIWSVARWKRVRAAVRRSTRRNCISSSCTISRPGHARQQPERWRRMPSPRSCFPRAQTSRVRTFSSLAGLAVVSKQPCGRALPAWS